ncbi:uncharacterized protein LOC144908886 [Branchiostoma floridae x Branchiostoma belcheri]
MKLSIVITVITTALILAGKKACYGQGCEPIQYNGCMGLSYNQTSFPNVYQWPSQDVALQAAPSTFSSYDPISDCHPDLNFFLCSLLFPQCTSEGQILPCRSLCNEINATCGERALAANIQWDASLCTLLSDDSCSRPNVPSITTSPATPSQQSNATATTAPTASQQANTTVTDAPTASQLANTTVSDAPTSSQQANTTATDAPTTGTQQDNTPTVGASGGAMATGGNADIVIGVVAAIAWAVALGNSG